MQIQLQDIEGRCTRKASISNDYNNEDVPEFVLHEGGLYHLVSQDTNCEIPIYRWVYFATAE